MKTLGRSFRASWAAAVLAVTLFTYASGASVVMQAAAAAAPSMPANCPMGMGGMAGDQHAPADAPASKGQANSCAFCSATAHAPILSAAPIVACPSSVAWQDRPAVELNGVRGPPSFRPRARGPPLPTLLS